MSTAVPLQTFVTYLVAVVFIIAGLLLVRKETMRNAGRDRLLLFGPLFVAMPLAVFACDHFFEARAISRMVPRWIPGSLFWAYFVGAALLCAAISILANRRAALAAALLGIMWLLFVVLMHIPAIVRFPHERITWNIALRDLSFAGGAFALAYSLEWRARRARSVLWAARTFIAIPVIVFGVEAFVYPLFLPGVPNRRLTPAWMPGGPAWSYATGVIEIATGVCLLLNLKARRAAFWLGGAIVVLTICVYVPLMFANASSIDNGLNYVADTLLFAGTALLLARAHADETEAAQVLADDVAASPGHQVAGP